MTDEPTIQVYPYGPAILQVPEPGPLRVMVKGERARRAFILTVGRWRIREVYRAAVAAWDIVAERID